MVSLLRAGAGAQPTIVVLDDVHAADEPSLLLLEHVAGAVRDERVLVLAGLRMHDPMVTPAVADLLSRLRQGSTQLELGGLDRADVGRFMAALRGDVAPPALVAAVHGRTDGNPFFVDGIVRLLGAGGQPVMGVAHSTVPLPLPAGVGDAVRRRLDRVADASRDVLDVAAVIGRDFSLALLRRVCGDRDVLGAIDEATAAGLVVERSGGVSRYDFEHALVRETLLNGMGGVDRMRVQWRVGEALEELLGPVAERHLDEIAYHFVAAAAVGDAAKAVSYAIRAGDRAMRMLAYEQAATHYERGLLALEFAPVGQDERRCDLLLALGAARRRTGQAAASRASFLGAAALARGRDDPERLASAALGLGAGLGGYGFVDRADRVLIGLLEEALRGLPPQSGARRVRVQARLATELYFTNRRELRESLSLEALEGAERLGDTRVLLAALYSRHWSMLEPDSCEARIEAAEQLVRHASDAGDRAMTFCGRHFRLATLLELGEIVGVDEEVEACTRLADDLREPVFHWQATAFRAMRALMRGDAAAGARLSDQALELGRGVQPQMATVIWGAQALKRHWCSGRLSEIEASVASFADHYTWAPAWRSASAFVQAELGHETQARAQLARLARKDFEDLPRDGNLLMALALGAHAAAAVGDRPRSALLYERLRPYADRHVTVAAGAVCTGSVAGYLGILANCLDHLDEADEYLAHATAAETATANAPFLARFSLEHAAVKRRRRRPGDAPQALALCAFAAATAESTGMGWLSARARALEQTVTESRSPTSASASRVGPPRDQPRAPAPPEILLASAGEHWTLETGGQTLLLADSRGLRHLARLLAHPGVEFHVLDLEAGWRGRGSARADVPGLHEPSDAGPVLDEQAKAEYRRRIEELRAESEEATSFNDVERAANARSELEFVASELARAVGLGGRDRRAASDTERARVNVTRTIRRALRKVAEQDPAVGQQLDRSVQTGTFCSFTPGVNEPPVRVLDASRSR